MAMMAANLYFLVLEQMWPPFLYAASLLVLGYLLLEIKRGLSAGKDAAENPSLDTAEHAQQKSEIENELAAVEINTLGRYQVVKELGKGAMGTVYLGKDPKINRTVAIKTLDLSEEFEQEQIASVKERFFREAETAGRLTHANIVTIYDAGEQDDLAYIAMEFLKGHDLYRYTKQDKLLPISQVIQIAILAADALHYAHQHNVIHRDIKPANIMYLPGKSTVKLTDFGIARIMDVSKTRTGMVLGTPAYMSPEQLTGKKNIDGRSDLFSLGVMLYQLLCGQLPFKGDSMATLMFKIANETARDICTIRPEIGKTAASLVPILDKMLEKLPENRYESGAVLASDLRNCLKNIKIIRNESVKQT